MTYQIHAHTSHFDDEESNAIRNQLSQGLFPDSAETGYAILYVDHDGGNTLLYAPRFFDVSSGHTGGILESYCPNMTKRTPKSLITLDEGLFQSIDHEYMDILLRDLGSSAATAVSSPIVRQKMPGEFLPFREYGIFEAKEADVQKLQLHSELND